MRSQGKFVFKGIEKRDGGEFTDAQGRNVKYDESYQLKLDEKTEKGIYERRLKVSKDNMLLVQKLEKLECYTEIELICDINFYGNRITVVPVDLVSSNNK
ncbi:MAG: hypothetical protein HFJ26_01205 [Clostridia bacterium]|nr:hypothetical protein [Clostridia bacterium]